MSASGGGKAIIAAFLANMGIALAKFIAWFFSGSASMLAEAIHSVADSGNQLLLLLGGRKAKKRADSEHPFGYGRERYVYAFVVSIILFSVGGLFSIYEGVDKITHPHELENVWIPLIVLIIAIGLESFSLRTAIKESNLVRAKGESWVGFIRHAKAPELPVVLLEDVARADRPGLRPARRRTHGDHRQLAVRRDRHAHDRHAPDRRGDHRSASRRRACWSARARTMPTTTGSSTRSRAVPRSSTSSTSRRSTSARTSCWWRRSWGSPATSPCADVAAEIDIVEARVREAVPFARSIYFEPDVYSAGESAHPPTEEVVIRSVD